jgi:LuxR family transcriptional regulator, regulator of acetate metabolism
LGVTRDQDVLRATLRNAARRTGLPVVFAGPVDRGRIVLSEFLGTRTSALNGVAIRPGAGLGGKAFALEKPCYVEDYVSAKAISHEYDTPIAQEGLTSLVAVPLRAAGRTRAIVYAGVHQRTSLGSRVTDALVHAVREGERELAVLDEVEHRLAQRPPDASTTALERLRGTHAELRAIAATVDDPVLKDRLLGLCDELTSAAGGITLSTRETDVLALVSRGMTNVDVAGHLSIGAETVKSYLRSAMTKLGATTRLEAVSRARSEGLLP